jgi:tyrosyl-tRNA synthetase
MKNTNKDIVSELALRGLIRGSTNRPALSGRMSTPISAFVGFDPTADSLHIGHLLGQITLRRLQLRGHTPIVLIGEATGMVGDPSGRSLERNLLDTDLLQHNVASISKQFEQILDFEPGASQAIIVNNASWTNNLNVLTFLRDIGKHITVDQMLSKESVKNRLASKNGLSFTEFSYMLLQANDFHQLFKQFGCEMQLGGSDQWGNITAGIGLIRKNEGALVHGLTWPLVTKNDGTKMGKTTNEVIWLDAKRTSPFVFFQHWMQLSDADAVQLLPRLSLLNIDEITQVIEAQKKNPHTRIAQRTLACELTLAVHGKRASDDAMTVVDTLFNGNPLEASFEVLKTISTEIGSTKINLTVPQDLRRVLVNSGLAESNKQASTLLTQHSVRANGIALGAHTHLSDISLLQNRWILLQKGKTSHHLLDVES